MSKQEFGTQSENAGRLGKAIASQMGHFTLLKVTEVGFANAKANQEAIQGARSIESLQESDLMTGDDALVVAAGPSVHRFPTAEVIRDSAYKGKIIATDSALYWCLRNGIVPSLVVTLDPHHSRIVRWFGDPRLDDEALSRDDYYTRQDMDPEFRQNQLETNRKILKLVNQYGPQIKIAISSSSPPSVVERAIQSGMEIYWWNPMYDDYDLENSLTRRIYEMNGLPCVNAGGNVGSACWVFSHAILQKQRVGLVGVDFGYYSDTPFGLTQYYKEIQALVGDDRMEEVFIRVPNPHTGTEFYTDPAYFWFRNAFLEMVVGAECNTHNCTGGGILFGPGVEWTPLEKYLASASNGVR